MHEILFVIGKCAVLCKSLVVRRTLNLGVHLLIGAYFLPVLSLLFEAHLEFRRIPYSLDQPPPATNSFTPVPRGDKLGD